jgi:iron complex transport system substrate-binding protein
MSEQARRRLAQYREHVARAKSRLAEKACGQSVVFLRFRQHTCVVYAQTLMFGPLLFDRLGLTADPAMPPTMAPGGWDVLSIERLSTLHAAHIFTVIDADSESYRDHVASTPMWRRIPAVQNGSVHRVEATTWLGGDGVLANEAIVDDVLAALVPEGAP